MSRRRRGKRGGGLPSRLPWDEVHPTLDLHGETAESARDRADRWLRRVRAEGVRTARIITGRGLHSAGPPVLLGEIDDLLRRLKGTVVDRFEREPGGGAFRVTLRKRDRPSRAPRPGSPSKEHANESVDPDLRRRAEESLAELGITPTPALISAEMRRLRGE